jgi:hypothetical protein
MHKGRLEAITDGVIAVIITIMVLEMKAPPGTDFAALASTLPEFITYALSYTNIAIFWNNHHHMLQVSERVDGRSLWANMFLLFWLSLVPFVIRWMDESGFAADCGLWLCSCDGRDRLSFAGADAYCVQRRGFGLGARRRKRFEREAFTLDLRRGDSTCLCSTVDRDHALYCYCAHMVCARPAYRKEHLSGLPGLARRAACLGLFRGAGRALGVPMQGRHA